MNDLISIIIPVYNAGKTIDSCVESVLKSTYSDFEILIIDDGSNVETAEECDKVALKDQRIKVIHQENGGVSKARNCGIENSKGKFITFVDADDTVDSDLLASMMNAISAVANVLLNFILISTWKENATAFTTLVAEGIMLGICGWKSREICKVKVFNKNLLTVCVGTAAVVGICFTVRMAKFQSTVELLISVVLSGIAYFIVLIALKNENVLKLMKKFLKIKA